MSAHGSSSASRSGRAGRSAGSRLESGGRCSCARSRTSTPRRRRDEPRIRLAGRREADLVLYDALAGREALSLAPRAKWFYVGKRARRRSIAQESIERLMIRAALRGERVVRLKCGDPFVLGRGGEEALALARAGIPYEVVPGVTSAVAAPAMAGIPVTHRGLSTGFVVVSGHAEEAYAPVLSSLPPGA